ncbi:hypothetical protein NX059_011085 [Plenodomus lindquistii]|nr:hypothetical protein NX059_011085 [Plenodomus lindquistii]
MSCSRRAKVPKHSQNSWRDDIKLDDLLLESRKRLLLESYSGAVNQKIGDHHVRDHDYLNHEDRTTPSTKRLRIDENESRDHHPKSFLDLPYELREMVYDNCLVTDAPVDCQGNSLGRNERLGMQKLAGCLLATCKLVNVEGREILYGKNNFRFFHEYDSLKVMACIPAHNFAWLKEITISIPQRHHTICVFYDPPRLCPQDDRYSHYGENVVVLGPRFWYTPDIQWYKECPIFALYKALLKSLNLNKLNLVVPMDFRLLENWQHYTFHPSQPNSCNQFPTPNFVIYDEALLRYLVQLVACRPLLKVTITGLIRKGGRLNLSEDRRVKRTAGLLGAWDIRTTFIGERSDDWKLSSQMMEDPMDIIFDIRSLYGSSMSCIGG